MLILELGAGISSHSLSVQPGIAPISRQGNFLGQHRILKDVDQCLVGRRPVPVDKSRMSRKLSYQVVDAYLRPCPGRRSKQVYISSDCTKATTVMYSPARTPGGEGSITLCNS